MKSLSQTRLIIYCLLLGLVPLVFVGMNYMNAKARQERLSFALSKAITEATSKNAKEFVNKQVRQDFTNSNHFYIDEQIETLRPLQTEVVELEKILSIGFHPHRELFRRRLEYHKTGQNRPSFVEGSVKSYSDFQETQESLAHPIDCNVEDIRALLTKIEGVSFDGEEIDENRPHLIITDWKMEKKRGPTQEFFTLDIKLIKREYLK